MENDTPVENIKLKTCSDELGDLFLKYLSNNYITYICFDKPTFNWNNKWYAMDSLDVKNFSEFVVELNKFGVDEIFLYKLEQKYNDDGQVIYNIRYSPNGDFLENNLHKLSKLFSKLESSFNNKISPAKIKLLIEKEKIYNDYEISEIMKFIRIFCTKETDEKNV